jgi:hypothetical protein
MPSLRQYFKRPLTFSETAIVLFLMGIAAGLIYAAYNFIIGQILEARVNAAIPVVCTAIRHQRDAVVNAIEAYKAQFGVYPPDHLVSRQLTIVDPVTNTLLYELTGVLYDPRAKMFQVAGLEPAEEEYVTNFFQCQRFKNCAEDAGHLKHFLSKDEAVPRQLHDDPDVFVLGFNTSSAAIPPELFWEIEPNVGSWRYVRSSPTNNPGKFDLWVEFKRRGRVVTIGNWKEVQ